MSDSQKPPENIPADSAKPEDTPEQESKPTETIPTESKLNSLLKSTLAILIAFVLTTLFVLFYVPVYLYRLLVIRMSHYFHPDFISELSSQSAIMATDSIYTRPDCAFVTKFVVDGEIKKEALESRLKTAIEQEKFGGLSNTLEHWLGFPFWKRCESFLLENHLELKRDEVTLAEIKEIHTSLVDKPFKRHQPLWECIVYTNVKLETVIKDVKQHSVVFFRVHQTMADGTSFLNIFDELKMIPESQGIIKSLVENTSKVERKEKIKLGLRVFFTGPYNLLREWVDAKFSGKNYLLMKGSAKSNTGTSIDDVNLESARKVAMSTLAPPVALTLSLIAGAIRRVLVKNGDEETVPKSFTLNVQMPIPFEADKLDNHVAFIPVEAPMDDEIPMKRLPLFLPVFADMAFSTTPFLTFGLVVLVGRLPTSLIPFFSRKLPLGSVIVNTYPVSNLKRRFVEHEVSEITVKAGCPSLLGGALCIVNSISYKGNISLSITQPKDLHLGDHISEEFKLCGTGGNATSLLTLGMGLLSSIGGAGGMLNKSGGGNSGGGLKSLLGGFKK